MLMFDKTTVLPDLYGAYTEPLAVMGHETASSPTTWTSTSSTYIFSSQSVDQIKDEGRVVGFVYYAQHTSPLDLQIWRCDVRNCTLVASHGHRATVTGYQYVEVDIEVMKGDMVGISFSTISSTPISSIPNPAYILTDLDVTEQRMKDPTVFKLGYTTDSTDVNATHEFLLAIASLDYFVEAIVIHYGKTGLLILIY